MFQGILKLLFCIAVLFITSCSQDSDDADLAQAIVGTYFITSAESSSSIYEPTIGDEMIVTKVDNTHIDLFINFSSDLVTDIALDNILISETSTNDYDLDKEFSNAILVGSSNESTIKVRVDYTNEDFIDFNGEK